MAAAGEEHLSSQMDGFRHWGDRTLIHVVEQDLRKKVEWSRITSVVFDLPPCNCCPVLKQDLAPMDQLQNQDESDSKYGDHDHLRECRDGSKALGITARVCKQEDGVMKAEDWSSTLVFAVNARCPLSTGRFSDVVEAAETFLLPQSRKNDEGGQDSVCRQIISAFCDGNSIIYYKVSSGLDVS